MSATNRGHTAHALTPESAHTVLVTNTNAPTNNWAPPSPVQPVERTLITSVKSWCFYSDGTVASKFHKRPVKVLDVTFAGALRHPDSIITQPLTMATIITTDWAVTVPQNSVRRTRIVNAAVRAANYNKANQ